MIEYDVEKSTYFSLRNPCTGIQILLVIRVQLTTKELTLYWLQSKDMNLFIKSLYCSMLGSWLDQILTTKDTHSEWHAIRPIIIVKLVLEILMTKSIKIARSGHEVWPFHDANHKYTIL